MIDSILCISQTLVTLQGGIVPVREWILRESIDDAGLIFCFLSLLLDYLT